MGISGPDLIQECISPSMICQKYAPNKPGLLICRRICRRPNNQRKFFLNFHCYTPCFFWQNFTITNLVITKYYASINIDNLMRAITVAISVVETVCEYFTVIFQEVQQVCVLKIPSLDVYQPYVSLLSLAWWQRRFPVFFHLFQRHRVKD